MAGRTVRRRRTTRRRNPIKTTGMVLVNPRRRRRSTARRTVRRTRRNPTRRRSTARRTTRRSSRRRNPVARRSTRRRSTRRRRRNPTAIRGRSRSRTVYRYRNPSRRRRSSGRRRRRNPARRRNPSMFKKIPVIGGVLSSMFSFLPQSLFGALSMEPVMAVTRIVSGYFPQAPASVVYVGVGLLLASLVPLVPMLSAATKSKLAVAVASASAGVAYYKMRTGLDTEAASEAAQLEMSGAGFGALGALLQRSTGRTFQGTGQMSYAGGGMWRVSA